MKRVVIIVLDSLGIGALPDAENYGDSGANTLASIKKAKPDLRIPNLIEMGIGRIDGVEVLEKEAEPIASYVRLAEMSKGKDTITGHWEIAGLYTPEPFRTFERFPDDFMKAFEEAIGVGTLGNYAASGTEIIKELEPEHKATGKPIIYTSADSVFQIAANTDVIPLEELYRYCEIAREMLVGELRVGRVIARPFIEVDGKYVRTSDRKDYAISPGGRTLLDMVKDAGKVVYTVGKINDIFNGQGVSISVHTKSNQDGIDKTIQALNADFEGLIFTNLVDFDSLYGHRRNGAGYGTALEEFDSRLPEINDAMKKEDVLIICADHGNDPAHTGWDHTREYVPALIYGESIRPGVNLGTRSTFADIAATAAEYLEVETTSIGMSFLSEIKV
ncbi:MAG: phosphopentomutase [Bacillota bacterium]|jgi:phosphopentomutase|nr:phosphopentomutase [Bacillota bacterium]